MWCLLAAYLTVINHKSPEDLDRSFTHKLVRDKALTHADNNGFMDEIFSKTEITTRGDRTRRGFKKAEIDRLSSLPGFVALGEKKRFDVLTSVKKAAPELCYNFFNKSIYDNKYIILKFTNPPHFCVLDTIEKGYGFKYFDPRGNTRNASQNVRIVKSGRRVEFKNRDLGPLVYCYVL